MTTTKEPVIKVKNVQVVYFMGKSNEVKALTDINLEIFPGEFVIFFGPSGCGKSTLLYAIAGLERNATGEIYVENTEVVAMNNRALEKHHQKTIGMIFQAFYLIPSLTVVQNVMMPQIAIGVELKDRKKKSLELLEYFGVGAQANKLPTELSGGQQQRVAISRSLVNDPDIILADEPVGNLDSKSASDVLSLIQDLNITQKKTVILVTHDPTHLDIANRVFYLKDGLLIDSKYNPNPRIIKRVNAPEEKKEEKLPEKETAEKTYTEAVNNIEGILLENKARELVLEVLTGLTSEEILSLEKYVKMMIQKGVTEKKIIYEYLDKNPEDGGLGLDRRRAKELTAKIKQMVEDMKILSTPLKKKVAHPLEEYVKQVRVHILENFNILVHDTEALDAIDEIIKDRIGGITDKKGVESRFYLDVKYGGAGLEKRIARKASKYLELVLLGRYTGLIKYFKKVKKIKLKAPNQTT